MSPIPPRASTPSGSADRVADLNGLRIALAGGGTGGHVVPGMHLLECLLERGACPADVLWFGAGRPIEKRVLKALPGLLPQTPFQHEVLELEAAQGGAPGLARLLWRALPAVLHARRALRAHGSQLLLGLGGYTTLPAVLAARSLGLPVCLLEINAVRGKATRWLSPLAARVFHAWPSTLPQRAGPRHLHVGAPLARAFVGAQPSAAQRVQALESLGLDPEKPLLLVLGGSQGASSINRFLSQFAGDFLAAGLQVLHQVGPGRLEQSAPPAPGYRALEYLDDVQAALSAATLVLCRGGASTLAEIAARACPSVVIPYPHHADAHQERNARLLGAGVRIVPDAGLGAELATELIGLTGATGASERGSMQAALAAAVPRDASERICSELATLLR